MKTVIKWLSGLRRTFGRAYRNGLGWGNRRTAVAHHFDTKLGTEREPLVSILIPTAGIDESNGDGYYILWPRDPQQTVNAVRAYLQRCFRRTHVGVIITDSKTSPLRVGVTGVALAYRGFQALNNYVGTKDLFGRALRMTKVNVVDALATAVDRLADTPGALSRSPDPRYTRNGGEWAERAKGAEQRKRRRPATRPASAGLRAPSRRTA